jgi:hypothetical protein
MLNVPGPGAVDVMRSDTRIKYAMEADVRELEEMLTEMVNGMPGCLDEGSLDELWDDVVVRMHKDVYAS